MTQRILISLAITCAMSALLASIFTGHFISVFGLSFIAQVVFFYIINSRYENNLILKAQELKVSEMQAANKQIAVIECPCNEKIKQEVDMRFDKDVIYQCSKCKKNIRADISVKALLTTEPIYFNDRS